MYVNPATGCDCALMIIILSSVTLSVSEVSKVLIVHPVLQRIQLSLHLSGQVGSNLLGEVCSQLLGLILPERLGHVKQSAHVYVAAETFSINGAIFWHPADNTLLSTLVLSLTAAAFEDPLQHTGVFAKAGPEEGTGRGVLSEPVDVENLGKMSGGFSVLHAQPVTKVVPKVVPEERPHGKRVVHNHLAWKEILNIL